MDPVTNGSSTEAFRTLADKLGLDATQAEALGSGDLSPLILGRISDPVVAAMAQCILQNGRREHPAETTETADMPDTDLKERLARARKVIRRLRSQTEAAAAVLGSLAELFGACAACWGENPVCANCNGLGGPGYRRPDPDRLVRWLAPALRRLNLRVVHAPAATTAEKEA